MSEKKQISLQEACQEFVNRVLEVCPTAQFKFYQSMLRDSKGKLLGPEDVLAVIVPGNPPAVYRYSVWQNEDGTVGGARWI